MGDNWAIRSIEECALDEPYATQIGPFGKALTPDAYQTSGVPLLRGVNVNQGRFHDDDFVFISEQDADRLAKFESFPGDVLLVHKGTLGKIGIMPKKRRFLRYIMGNSMLRVRCDPDKLLPEFLYYWLCSPDGQHYIFSRVSQVGVPQIQRPLSTLRAALLPVPGVTEQRAITDVLVTLDDALDSNLRISQALVRLARAVFRAWFVDFEPVKAKAAGAQSFPGMSKEVFGALPSRFIDSELGRIPEGWTLSPFSGLCNIISGGTPKRSMSEYWDGNIPWCSVKDAPSNGEVWVTRTEERITRVGLENSAATLVAVGCTIISARGTVGRLAMAGEPMAFNQSCYGLMPTDSSSFYHLYLLAETLVSELQQRTHGSVFETITRSTFDTLLLKKPSADLILSFEKAVAPLFDKMLGALKESEKLARMRDYLLPKLLSGVVHVKDEA